MDRLKLIELTKVLEDRGYYSETIESFNLLFIRRWNYQKGDMILKARFVDMDKHDINEIIQYVERKFSEKNGVIKNETV